MGNNQVDMSFLTTSRTPPSTSTLVPPSSTSCFTPSTAANAPSSLTISTESSITLSLYVFDIRTRPHTLSSISSTKDLQMVNLTLRVLSHPEVARLPRSSKP
ncbi:prohibitin-3 [Pyrus ussuriensis x Pyrus communis]|uniref:Prohibitin n=1 Tax=Pyrus ussuriensis x Pyrus communis TaxID=2448454 RepID=A0A5N5FDI7_9ROSA|nr:prohibitin-3 [Pyrus ussuriensis x Pyrus communis]